MRKSDILYFDLLLIICSVEIDPDVDFDSRRAVYFRQMRYGLFVSDVRSDKNNGSC